MNIKKNYLILITVSILLVFLIIGSYWLFFAEREKDLAELTLSWLDSQKNNEGIYRASYSSRMVGEEDENIFYYSRIFPSILWGKLKYYEKNSDYEGIIELEKELDLAINTPTQNNQWNCKLMEDFWKSDILSQEQKDKAKLYCRNSGGEGFIDEEMHNVSAIGSEKVESFILKNIDNIIDGRPLSFDKFYDADSLRVEFRKITAYTSNDVARCLLEKEDNEENEEIIDIFKKGAFYGYYLALQGYSVVEKTIENNSLLGIVSLDLYRITNEEKHLNLALHLFNENKELELQDISHNYDYIYFGLFAEDIFKVTGEEVYKEERERIRDKIIENQFIYPFSVIDDLIFDSERGAFRSGTGSFYLTKENALMLGLLSI